MLFTRYNDDYFYYSIEISVINNYYRKYIMAQRDGRQAQTIVA